MDTYSEINDNFLQIRERIREIKLSLERLNIGVARNQVEGLLTLVHNTHHNYETYIYANRKHL